MVSKVAFALVVAVVVLTLISVYPEPIPSPEKLPDVAEDYLQFEAGNGVQTQRLGLEDLLNAFVNSINCEPSSNNTAADEEVLTAYWTCYHDVNVHDGTCMLPCIANEMGFIVGGQLRRHAVSKYIFRQFQNMDAAGKAKWMQGIERCWNHYESSGGKFPTEYKDCYKETEGLLKFSNCILIARDCPETQFTTGVTVKQRKKRDPTTLVKTLLVVGSTAYLASLLLSAVAIQNSIECGTSGCYKGHCYSYCGLDNDWGDWCYSTKSFSQSYEYVKCESNLECEACWKCAGSCTLG